MAGILGTTRGLGEARIRAVALDEGLSVSLEEGLSVALDHMTGIYFKGLELVLVRTHDILFRVLWVETTTRLIA